MSPRAAWRLESLGFTRVFDYAPGKLDWFSAGLPREGAMAGVPNLGSVARRDAMTCRLTEPISEIRARMPPEEVYPCVVVNDQRIVLGLVRTDALKADGQRTAEDVMLSGPVTFRPNVSLEEMASYMEGHGVRQALVTTSDGELLGMASREDVEKRRAGS